MKVDHTLAVRSWRSNCQVISIGRLVIDDRDRAGGAHAERILSRCTGDPTWMQWIDLGGVVVRSTLDLIQCAVVVVEERSHGAVSGYTGRTSGGEDVAWAGYDKAGEESEGDLPGARYHSFFSVRRFSSIVALFT